MCLVFVALAVTAVPFGLATGFLEKPQLHRDLVTGVITSLSPGMLEELLFRVLPFRGPHEGANSWGRLLLVLLVFAVPYHLDAMHGPNPVFDDPRFLTLALLLGIACSGVYCTTGSLWLAAVTHWLPVWLWLSLFGGMPKLQAASGKVSPRPGEEDPAKWQLAPEPYRVTDCGLME